MKGFFKVFFASLLAIAVAGGGIFVLLLGLFTAIGSLSQSEPQVEDGSVLVFDMSAAVQDRPVGMTPDAFVDQVLLDQWDSAYSLRALTEGIREAARDERIKGILLQGSFLSEGLSSGFPALKEIREALSDFRESGKAVWAYVVYPSSRDLYVISEADAIYMNPEGMLMDAGMVMAYPFLGGFMDKYGIGVQVTRAGEYKAAAEGFVLKEMSAPAREANAAVLDDFWAEYLEAIAQGAEIEPEEYEAKLNELGMLAASEALELGVVDELVHVNELVAKLQGVAGADSEGKSFKQTPMSEYLADVVKPQYSSDGYVAVVYAEGSIVNGEGEENEVGGARLSREIRQARKDEKVKAIVLRVNSPGGSALASEAIQHELKLAQEKMPVVVSMGSLAASGGYWISAYGDKIYAQSNTLTGSIGVIGVFFNIQELAADHGVTFDSVKTTEHADVMSVYRPKTEEEMVVIQRHVDLIYESFLAKVAEGRELDLDEVRELAGGRIWSGADALDLGLVDELGGLGDAIAYAGEQAGLGSKPAVKELPEPVNFLEEILETSMASQADARLQGPARELAALYRELLSLSRQFNDPKGVYAIMPYSVKIN